MNIGKMARKSFVVGTSLITAFGLASLLSYNKHEKAVYETHNAMVMEKADFLTAYTRLEIGKNEPYLKITKVNWINYRSYVDADGDGTIDHVFLSTLFPFFKPKIYSCKKNSEENNKICKKADEEFEKELIRFRD
jgi:hypothetical protein